MKRFEITPNDAGQRLDKFLMKAVPILPRGMMYKYIREKRIKLNGKRCEISHKLAVADVLELYIRDDFFAEKDLSFTSAPPIISVVYEDENILLADKPPGLLVHEDNGGECDTLIHRIQHYLYSKGTFDPREENSFSPALCNRIDRNTGGIVIAAKTFSALQIMSEKIKQREVRKFYLCLACGIPTPSVNTLKGWHIKDHTTNTVRILREPHPEAKTALTRYRVLRDDGANSLLEVELLTGRTHQIRVHMASIGHPLMGDTKYGHESVKVGGRMFQALYSYKIIFDFKTPAGCLDYLSGKSFEVSQVPFSL